MSVAGSFFYFLRRFMNVDLSAFGVISMVLADPLLIDTLNS